MRYAEIAAIATLAFVLLCAVMTSASDDSLTFLLNPSPINNINIFTGNYTFIAPNCSVDEVWKGTAGGDMVCAADATAAGAGNSTAEIWAVCDNRTFQDNLWIDNCTAGLIWKADAGGDMVCSADASGAGGANVAGHTGIGYLYNNSANMSLNETLLNLTIDQRERDTYNTSLDFATWLAANQYFNESWLLTYGNLTGTLSDIIVNGFLNITGTLNLTGGYIDIENILRPSKPGTNYTRIFSEYIKNFSILSFMDDTGRIVKIPGLIPVKNIRGTTIPANRLVYVTGNDENMTTVDLAKADNISTMPAIGITIMPILDDNYGMVMQYGLLENVDTQDGFDVGDILYVSDTVAGMVRSTPPTPPNYTQEMGALLVESDTVGAIQVITRSMIDPNLIFSMANNGTFQNGTELYNSTPQIWGVCDNGSFQYDVGADCGAGEYTYGVADDGTLQCRADVSGGGGGASIFMATGAWNTNNVSAGGQINMNLTGNFSGKAFISTGDQFCNGTAITPGYCYTVAQLALDTDTTQPNSSISLYMNNTGFPSSSLTGAVGTPNSSISLYMNATGTPWSSITGRSLSIAWTGQLAWGNITGYPALGNTSAQMSTAINASGVPWAGVTGRSLSIAWTGLLEWGNITGYPALGNSSSQMSTAINASGVPYTSVTGLVQGTPNSSVSLYINNTGVPANSITGFSSRVNSSGVPAAGVTGFSQAALSATNSSTQWNASIGTFSEYVVVPENKKVCFGNCTIYIMFNTTTQNLTFSNGGG